MTATLASPADQVASSADSVRFDYVEVCQDALRRAENLLRREIDFISNPEFVSAGIESDCGTEILTEDELDSMLEPCFPRDLPPHLAVLCEARLLDADEERQLFRKMNYLKFRANAVRSTLDPNALDVVALEQVEGDLDSAMRVRDRIVRSNMRLVISVVKKFVTPKVCFDELLSEGIDTLMNAVEKFDYDRGFRFSTYAYRSIARHSYRVVNDRQRDSGRFITGSETTEFDTPDLSNSSSMNERAWANLRSLLSNMMHHLDRREQFIIRGRYALGAHRKVRSFQCLADKLGISKERVRQLESRAVNKLRTMAAEHDPDNMVETLSLV